MAHQQDYIFHSTANFLESTPNATMCHLSGSHKGMSLHFRIHMPITEHSVFGVSTVRGQAI